MTDVFILAQHRTGSTLLKNMLDAHPDVCMAFDEMNLFEPLRSNTLERMLERDVKKPEELLDAIYSGNVYGTFWQRLPDSGLDRAELLNGLKGPAQLSADSVLRVVLQLLRERHDVSCSGIKYPVHVSRTRWLLEHFSESRVLFLFRNPMAVVASKINDEATRTRKKKSLLHRFGVHYFTLFYFCLEFRKACKVYQANRRSVFKVCYEELVRAPEETLRGVCDYLGISFHPEMLSATGKSSSYSGTAFDAPVVTSVDRYRERLSRFDMWLIRLITESPYKEIS